MQLLLLVFVLIWLVPIAIGLLIAGATLVSPPLRRFMRHHLFGTDPQSAER